MSVSDAAVFNQGAWQKLHASVHDREFCSRWLNIQCSMMHDVYHAAVYLDPQTGSPLAPTAFWPEKFQASGRFEKAVHRVLSEKKCFTFLDPGLQSPAEDENSYIIGCPFKAGTEHQGIAVFQVYCRSARELQIVTRQIQWSMAWLENLFLRRGTAAGTGPEESLEQRLMTIFDVVSAALEENGFKAAATVAVTELANRVACERVSMGFTRKKQSVVIAVSHSAQFARKMNLVNTIGAAMDESIDQAATVLYPEAAGKSESINRCQAALHREFGSPAILTVPFLDVDGKGYGAVTFERGTDTGFDSSTVLLCEAVSALLGPILKEKQLNDLPFYRKAAIHFTDLLRRVFGPGNPVLKFVLCCLAGLLLFITTANGDYRISASSVLEGTVQRSVIAPFDGYLFEAPARAGDIVSRDQIMAGLDIRDLLLQRLKWTSQQKQFALKYNKALAENNIAESKIIREQISQAETEVSLLDEHIERASIRAPFDGIIITGDWTQAIGAPVERGQTLYQIAPLDSYRIMLQVAESDIDQVAVGQEGELVLNALPGTPYVFKVVKITPVATTREGSNFFLVEGRIMQDSEKLRPGMQGYGKIYIAQRKLIWIWMHDLIDWMRIWIWTRII